MPTPTPLLHDVSTSLHYRRLLQSPVYKLLAPMAASASEPAKAQDPLEPYAIGNGFDANVVMVMSVLFCALICSLGLNSIVRCALRCSSFVATEPNNNDNTSAPMANTGIKKKALKTFPTVTYSPDLKLPGLDAECVICLSEFAAGERVRLLPKCNHGFHLRCIDKWLNSHSSCPTCRHCLIETCQKIVSCSRASSSQQQPLSLQESTVTITPLEREDMTHNYRASS